MFNTFSDTCTGIITKKDSTKSKVNILCKDLILIPRDFNSHYLLADYDSLDLPELDSSDTKEKNWRVAMGDDEEAKIIYNVYRKIVLSEKLDATMEFYTRRGPNQDELRDLCVNVLDDYSYAVANYVLDDNSSFLLVAQ